MHLSAWRAQFAPLSARPTLLSAHTGRQPLADRLRGKFQTASYTPVTCPEFSGQSSGSRIAPDAVASKWNHRLAWLPKKSAQKSTTLQHQCEIPSGASVTQRSASPVVSQLQRFKDLSSVALGAFPNISNSLRCDDSRPALFPLVTLAASAPVICHYTAAPSFGPHLGQGGAIPAPSASSLSAGHRTAA